ncbi:hypothetical protein [Paenibacillus silvae]|uniref:hypothetical protein n=1 Tax=Paenibacillus silvae TaxID=1325358 RepID=UPI00142E1E01|nr:hypothetical protein [Paenibacillus silvae]
MKKVTIIAKKVADGVHNVSAATQQQFASMEEIASSATLLAKMAGGLQEQISKFKL